MLGKIPGVQVRWLLPLLFCTSPAWAAMSISPSPSYSGSYTVSWVGSVPGAGILQEKVNGGAWVTQSASGTSKAYSGKASGTYTYRIAEEFYDPYMLVTVQGPISVTVQTPAVPTGLASPPSDDDGSFSVDWNNATGASDYDLGEKFNSNAWTTISNITTSIKARSGLANGTWTYRVRACSAVGCSAWSATVSTAVLPVPLGLAVGGGSPNYTGSYTVSWNAAAGVDTYELQERINGGNWVVQQNTSALSKAYSGKVVGTYDYQVRACLGTTCGDWSGIIPVTVSAPPAPSGLSVSGGSPNATGGYTVSWNTATAATTYELQQRVNSGSWVTEQNSSSTSKVYSAKPESTFEYKVRACGNLGCGTWSITRSVTVNYPAPGTISDLSAPAGSSTSNVALGWVAATGYVTHHEIEKTHLGQTATVNTGSATASHTVTDLSNGSHQFRTRACNATNECGAWSNPQVTVVSVASVTAAPPSTTSPTDTPEAPGAAFNGVVRGIHDVTASGAATYTIPIEVPPGTRGLQPALSLTYSSHNGNGLAGVGWALSGAGAAILRCGQSLVENGVTHGVDYSTNDRFCFDGQQLVVANGGTYGADGTEYRTRIDSIARFKSHGPLVGGAPAYFTMETKSGLVMEFGNTTNSLIEATGQSQAARWLLNRVSDRSRNFYVVTYEEDVTNGEFRPGAILYTAHVSQGTPLYFAKVEFSYESRNTNEQMTQYLSGSKSRQSKRLSRIKVSAQDLISGVYSGPYKNVREYQLTYELGGADPQDVSRLGSVRMCAGENLTDCTLSTTFAWTVENDGYQTGPNWTAYSPGGLQVWADLNGDGRMDYVRTSGNDHRVSTTNVAGTDYEPVAVWPAHDKGDSNVETFIDLNGDGRADYVTTAKDGAGTQYWSLSTGTSYAGAYQTVTSGIDVVNNSDVQKFIDMDGDSLPDYVRVRGSDYKVALNQVDVTPANPLPASQNWSGGPDLTGAVYSFHDVNLDGRADLVTITGTSHSVHINNGTGFNAPQTWQAHANSDPTGQ